MLAVMTKFRNVCAHSDRLFDFRTKDALCDMKIHERLFLPREYGRYVYGKNDLFAQLIILKLLLPEDEFKTLFHELKIWVYEEKSVIKIFYDNDRGGKLVPELSTLVLELYGFVDINTTTG